jgi:hypothetical protein
MITTKAKESVVNLATMPRDPAIAIEWYLHGYVKQDGWVHASSFRALLRDARGATGRDRDDGRVVEGEHSPSWLGALGYLVLLDQLGGALRTRDAEESPSENAFFTGLRVFAPEVTEEDRWALYALRCSLAHHYTLHNPHGDPRLRHYFTLDPERGAPLVSIPPPDQRWNGRVDEGRQGEATVVGLRTLGDLLESIVARLENTPLEELRIAPCVGGPADLLTRYSFNFFE